ncbi:MAG: hypothetical protein NZZ41_07635 [Candidatus Dojkabacteria bacterium]|nr:hypothetical protein [Candidatus Dojkabacteria bacterium]
MYNFVVAIANYRGAICIKRNEGFKEKASKNITSRKKQSTSGKRVRWKDDYRYFYMYSIPAFFFPLYYERRNASYGNRNDSLFFYYWNLLNNYSENKEEAKKYLNRGINNLTYFAEYKNYFFFFRSTRDADERDIAVFNYISNLTIFSDYYNLETKNFNGHDSKRVSHNDYSFKINRFFLNIFLKEKNEFADLYQIIDFKKYRIKIRFESNIINSFKLKNFIFYRYESNSGALIGMEIVHNKYTFSTRDKSFLKMYLDSLVIPSIKGEEGEEYINQFFLEHQDLFHEIDISKIFFDIDTIGVHYNYKIIFYAHDYKNRNRFYFLFLSLPVTKGTSKEINEAYFLNFLFFVIKNKRKRLCFINKAVATETEQSQFIDDDAATHFTSYSLHEIAILNF